MKVAHRPVGMTDSSGATPKATVLVVVLYERVRGAVKERKTNGRLVGGRVWYRPIEKCDSGAE